MTRRYTFRVFQMRKPTSKDDLDHVELGSYENLEMPPWVPHVGSYFRFRDHHPPNQQVDHNEKKGKVKEVVTCFYGTNTTVEVYIEDDNAR